MEPIVLEISSDEEDSYSRQKDVDDDEDDCVVLDGDPDKPLELSHNADKADSDDLLIVGEKGKIACRDFPHPRHDCAEFPFKSTSHVKHCNKCHCYVCDSPAPCIYWGVGLLADDHCNATDKEEKWQIFRKNLKLNNTALTPVSSPVTGSVSAVLPSSCHPMLQGNFQPVGHLRLEGVTEQVPICPLPNDLGNIAPHKIMRQPFRVQRIKGDKNVGVANHFRSSKPTFKRVGTVGSSLTNSSIIPECMSVVHHVAPNGQISDEKPNNHHEPFTNSTSIQPCRSRISSTAMSCQPVAYSLPNNQLLDGQSMYFCKSKNLDHLVSSGFPDISLSWESILRECDAYCPLPVIGSIDTQFTELSHKSPPVERSNSQYAGSNDPISAGVGLETSLFANTPQETLPAVDPNTVDTGLPFFDFGGF